MGTISNQSVIVIGAGFAGLSAASYLAQSGYDVTVLEKHTTPGGRARKFEVDGFVFDMGPSWYWMPEVFEQFFADFGYRVSDFYDLRRLDPSYRIYFGKDDKMDVPAHMQRLEEMFEEIEPGSAPKLRKFLHAAAYKYRVGMQEFVHKPSLSVFEFADFRILKSLFKLNLFSSISKEIRGLFKHPKLIKLLEFPVLFLGATPQNTPSLYSLMNYADLSLGTWYPMGGMHKIVDGMYQVAKQQGVKFEFNTEVAHLKQAGDVVSEVVTSDGRRFGADIIIGGADYHHIETQLLDPDRRSYSERYWEKRTMAPSCLLYYVGVNKRLNNLLHHNLFFDEDFAQHAHEIYTDPAWPSKPLFYVSAPSVTDQSVAPSSQENLFVLIPVAPGLEDTPELRNKYFHMVMQRLEHITGQQVREHITYVRSYAHKDFVTDYNAFKGNAYGLANTLLQTAFLKPKLKSKKLKNLYFTGQLTTPGPGVPPSLISGKVVAGVVGKALKNQLVKS